MATSVQTVKAKRINNGFELGTARLEYMGQDSQGQHLWAYSRLNEWRRWQPIMVVDDPTAIEIFQLLGGGERDG